jgi:hypothetical protein
MKKSGGRARKRPSCVSDRTFKKRFKKRKRRKKALEDDEPWPRKVKTTTTCVHRRGRRDVISKRDEPDLLL